MLHFHTLCARMSIKMHFLFSHLDRFLKNSDDVFEEKGEWFYKDIRVMNDSMGCDVNILPDYILFVLSKR